MKKSFEIPPQSKLIESFQSGDSSAFDTLFRQHYAPLCLFASHYGIDSMLAEDIAEEAFLKAWEQRVHFHSLPALRSFLYTVTRNAALNSIRDAKRHREAETSLLQLQPVSEPNFSEAIIRSEIYRELHEAIQQLPPLYREVLELCYLEELDYPQIAEKLGRPVNTIRMQRLRAITMLRKQLPHLTILLAALIT